MSPEPTTSRSGRDSWAYARGRIGSTSANTGGRPAGRPGRDGGAYAGGRTGPPAANPGGRPAGIAAAPASAMVASGANTEAHIRWTASATPAAATAAPDLAATSVIQQLQSHPD